MKVSKKSLIPLNDCLPCEKRLRVLVVVMIIGNAQLRSGAVHVEIVWNVSCVQRPVWTMGTDSALISTLFISSNDRVPSTYDTICPPGRVTSLSKCIFESVFQDWLLTISKQALLQEELGGSKGIQSPPPDWRGSKGIRVQEEEQDCRDSCCTFSKCKVVAWKIL